MVVRSVLASSLLCAIGGIFQPAMGASTTHSFVEDNDLWKEDGMFEKESMTQAEFDMIIDNAYTVYAPIAKSKNNSLTINHKWDDSTVNANCSNMGGRVTINMFGGLARRPEVTREGFALVLCHELGHAFGGAPYVNPIFKLSAEGMSDYYGAGTCMSQILKTLATDVVPVATDFMRTKCEEKHGANTEGYTTCLRQLDAGQSLGNLLAVLKKEGTPNYETPDPTVVSKTLPSYPATIQCRLDTYGAGSLELPRPACWFKD
jgi:hypothetical protein